MLAHQLEVEPGVRHVVLRAAGRECPAVAARGRGVEWVDVDEAVAPQLLDECPLGQLDPDGDLSPGKALAKWLDIGINFVDTLPPKLPKKKLPKKKAQK